MKRALSGLFALLFLILPTAAHATCPMPGGAPDAGPGTMVYNADHAIMQYCNGTDWVGMGTQPPPISESTAVHCSGTLLPLVLSCTATCPDGYWRSGCYAAVGGAMPTGERSCFCALADPQCTAFCLK